MAKKGLRSWVQENWVDIANKKPDGSYPKFGRSGGDTDALAFGRNTPGGNTADAEQWSSVSNTIKVLTD